MASIQKRASGRYRVQVRVRGVYRSATLPSLVQARKWAARQEHALYEAYHFQPPESTQHTLRELLERYAAEVLPRKAPGTQAHQRRHLAWWTAQLGHLRLHQVTPARLTACRTRLASGLAPGTVNLYLATLSHAYTVALHEWGWVEASPLRRVGRLREPRGRVRCLMDDERVRLLAACAQSHQPLLLPVVIVALSTGARKMEILRLTWTDIDWQHSRLLLHDTKNRERRSVPLMGKAFAVMQTLGKVRRIDTALCFPRADGTAPIDVRFAFKRAIQDAGITDFRFHDLRHSCASYLAMNGASLVEIAEVLGHKSLAMVRRYAHLTEQHTAGVVARMNTAIFG
jgi:integrase